MRRYVANLSRRTTELVYSTPLRFIAIRHLAIPLHCLASLCIAYAKRFSALPLLFPASHSIAVADLCVTWPCRRLAERFAALPFHSASMQCYSVASRFRCFAPPGLAQRLVSVASHCFALPFRCVTGSPPRRTGLCRCCATGRCRRNGHSPAIPGRLSHDRRRGRPPGTRR